MSNSRDIIEYCKKKNIDAAKYNFNISRVEAINKFYESYQRKLEEPKNLAIIDEINQTSIEIEDNNEEKISKEDFLFDLQQMQEILQNKEIINRQLEKLEQELKNSSCSLMILLYNWSIENGFSDKWVRVTTLVYQTDFLDILKKRQLIKDYGVSPLHGEFSHVLQFYIICEANKENQYLKNPIADIYARMGSYDCRFKSDLMTLWDLIVDRRLSEKCPPHDARCPERLMGYIESCSGDYPLLSGAIRKKYVLLLRGLFAGNSNGKEHMQLFDKQNKLPMIKK